MVFLPKEWQDFPDVSTPINRASLRDLETRLGGYTDIEVAADRARLLSLESDRALKAHIPAVDVREYASGFDLTGASDNSAQMWTAVQGGDADDRALFVPPGIIMCAHSVTGFRLLSGTHLIGAGMARTTLKLLPSSLSPILGTFDGSGNSIDDVTLEGLTLDGDRQNSTVTPGSGGGGLLHSYKAQRWHLSRVRFKNSRSYGMAWQGIPADASAAKRGPHTDLYMEFCEFLDNGYEANGASTSGDGIDVKSSERVVMIGCYAKGNTDKGFNVRGRALSLVQCVANANVHGFDFNAIGASAPNGFPDMDTWSTLMGCHSHDNTGYGFAMTTTTDSAHHASLLGCHSRRNASSGLFISASSTGKMHASVSGGSYTGNTGAGILIDRATQASVDALVKGNGGDGVKLTDQSAGARINGDIRDNTGWGVLSTGTSRRVRVDATLDNNTAGTISLVGVGNVKNGRTDIDNGQAGLLAPTTRAFGVGPIALTANRAYYARIVPSRDMRVTGVVFGVSSADAANPNADVGIYDVALARIAVATAAAGIVNSTGRKSIAFTAPVVLRAGEVYYAALSTAGAPTLVGATLGVTNAGVSSGFFGAGWGVEDAMQQAGGHPLPASATPATVTSATPIPVLAVIE